MSFSLRELTHDQEAILALVENGDFTLDDVSDHLEMLEEDRNQKIENYLHVINRLGADVDIVSKEITRLIAIQKTKDVALSNTKDWLLMSMKDGEKHEFDLFKVTRVKGREVLNITNEQAIPKGFMINKPESWSIDKRKLLNNLKELRESGLGVEGAEITTGNPSLRIK